MPVAAFVLAYAMDWVIGDPEWLPHPVRWMGKLTTAGETWLRCSTQSTSLQFLAGMLLTLGLIGIFGIGSWRLLSWLHTFNGFEFFLVSVCLGASTLATRSLLRESRDVRRLLQSGDLTGARIQLARIVGRDTKDLDE